ncbi:TonB-dependent receptor [Indioceanicola profundi]|uniref:TonB-dependent receptor n=1 Tax=Indioceanicola profundi TaxID=2220096 RepID=UPI0019692A1C|nr:TonB-dependent receptor [Indioceanicola profundi]
MKRLSGKLLVATALSAGVLAGMPAVAQQQPGTGLEEIVVTGSRIKREDITGVGPATVLTNEFIQSTGIASVETLLQRLPSSAGFAGNQTSAYWTSNGWGTAQVNLRGLGANRTLVLLNGRRIVPGGTGANSSPDLNTIPVSIIERIDVLKDGASAIYGADAVAGVVNVITRDDFEGVEVSAKYGITEEGDGEEKSADLTWGLSGEKGNFVASLTYYKSEPVNMADREPCGLGEVDGELVCVGSSATIGGRALLPTGQRINFNQTPGGDGDFFEPYNGAIHNFNSNPYLNAVNPIERISASAFGNINVTDDVKLFTELMFTNRQSTQLATPGSLRNLSIPATNPTNPTGQDIILEQRRLMEPGPRDFFQDVDTWRTVVGLTGDLANGWTWETAFNWGRTTGIDGSNNIANLDRVGDTLNTDVCSFAAGAAIPCGDYLGAGDLSPEVLDYILFTMRDSGGNEQISGTFDITGSLFALPAGDVGFAAGVVYREEKGWRDPDPLTVLGVANTNQQDPISGEFTAKEAYVELAVPVLSNLPFVQRLDVNAAARYSDYDLFGSDENYKLGLDWQVIDGVRLRATYATAFRIPNVPELFGGVAEGNLTTTDPCSGYASLPAGSVVAQNCAASGVPAGYQQLGNTILTTVGGNENLDPESAESFTVGAVYQPPFVEGLTLTVDYFDITIKDAIRAIPGSTKLAVCYESAGLSHPFCGPEHFTRNALTGDINFLSAQPVNTGREEMKGVDFGLIYEFSIGEFAAAIDWNTTYLDTYTITPFQGAEEIVFDGFIGGGNGGFPHWRSNVNATLAGDRWSGTYSVQWIGKATDFNASEGDIGHRTPNVFYHNVQVGYDFNDQARIAVGVDNLFDEDAPFIQSWTDANTDTMTYDLLGRRGYVRLTYTF